MEIERNSFTISISIYCLLLCPIEKQNLLLFEFSSSMVEKMRASLLGRRSGFSQCLSRAAEQTEKSPSCKSAAAYFLYSRFFSSLRERDSIGSLIELNWFGPAKAAAQAAKAIACWYARSTLSME